jgi:hypothetical protein
MTIWICQFVGREIRLLDYIEGVGQPLGYYATELRRRGWGDAIIHLPHVNSRFMRAMMPNCLRSKLPVNFLKAHGGFQNEDPHRVLDLSHQDASRLRAYYTAS